MLSALAVKKIKPESKTKRYTDEKSMYLEVTPKGGMLWRLRYRLNGKENIFSIGTYPEISLAEAREVRDDAKKIIKQGISPTAARKQAKIAKVGIASFETIANQLMNDKRGTITESSYKHDCSLLRRDILPAIGKMPIDTIKAPHLLEMAKKVEARGAGTVARKSLRLTGTVMRYAKRLGLIEYDPTTGLSEALKPRKTQHMARIPESELPLLLQKIDAYIGEEMTRIALKIITLTFVRSKELRNMEWSEVDFDKKEWRIPASKMKMGKVHIIPLSTQVIALLERLKLLTGDKQYAFYSSRSFKPIGESTLLNAIWRLGFKDHMTVHGFRGLASTILHEKSYLHAAIELQLAHSDKDQVSASYNYAGHLPYRRKMMQEWADYIDELRSGVIVHFPKAMG